MKIILRYTCIKNYSCDILSNNNINIIIMVCFMTYLPAIRTKTVPYNTIILSIVFISLFNVVQNVNFDMKFVFLKK